MSKIRVHSLAKEMGISSQEMVQKIREVGLDVKSYMSTIDEETAKLIKDIIKKKDQKNQKKIKEKLQKSQEKVKETPISKAGPQKPTNSVKTIQKPVKIKGKKPEKTQDATPESIIKHEEPEVCVKLVEAITVKELAEKLSCPVNQVIKKLMEIGIMATINQVLDTEVALSIAEAFGIKAKAISIEGVELIDHEEKDESKLVLRPPVVTVMGHVDHGKTLLLDAIRKSDVASREHGGITQHIGAYKVTLPEGEITFLDTPGHEAFTAMRARGAQITDIVVLVVAADDGVMPQTKEAINHAKSADVPIVVAINKIDKPEADPQKVRTELAKYDLVPEEWGGRTIFCEISAKKQIGIENLLEMILLEAEMLELKANPDRKALGTIIESKLDRGMGPVATVLVKNGTLKIGDPFVCGIQSGRVRAMINDKWENVEHASPSSPVEVLGFSGVPKVGDSFVVVCDDRKARQISAMRQEKQRTHGLAQTTRMDLEHFLNKIKEGEIQELNIVLKADVQGSVQAISEALERLSTPQVKLNVIHGAVGAINETDVLLASSTNAVIIGFGVRPESKASALAEREHVELRLFTIIYDLIDTVQSIMKGILKPTYKEIILGKAEVRETFNIPKAGTIAGSYVLEGKISRGCKARLLRDNVVVYEGKIGSLKRFKDDVKDVQNDYECGIGIENFNDIKIGDIIECYMLKEVEATL
ncbi:translation initiation factor IF-2 [bacterium]|nr:translation initiation factor IF-2 [bacterium]